MQVPLLLHLQKLHGKDDGGWKIVSLLNFSADQMITSSWKNVFLVSYSKSPPHPFPPKLTVTLLFVVSLDGGDGGQAILFVLLIFVTFQVRGAQSPVLRTLLQATLLVVTADRRSQPLLLFLSTDKVD